MSEQLQERLRPGELAMTKAYLVLLALACAACGPSDPPPAIVDPPTPAPATLTISLRNDVARPLSAQLLLTVHADNGAEHPVLLLAGSEVAASSLSVFSNAVTFIDGGRVSVIAAVWDPKNPNNRREFRLSLTLAPGMNACSFRVYPFEADFEFETTCGAQDAPTQAPAVPAGVVDFAVENTTGRPVRVTFGLRYVALGGEVRSGALLLATLVTEGERLPFPALVRSAMGTPYEVEIESWYDATPDLRETGRLTLAVPLGVESCTVLLVDGGDRPSPALSCVKVSP